MSLADAFHLETKKEVDASSVKVIEDGPLRSSLLATYHYGKSVIKVRSKRPVRCVDDLC